MFNTFKRKSKLMQRKRAKLKYVLMYAV